MSDIQYSFELKLKDKEYNLGFLVPSREETTLADLNVDDFINQTGMRILDSLDNIREVMKKEQSKLKEEDETNSQV